jgi:hypothetical protein
MLALFQTPLAGERGSRTIHRRRRNRPPETLRQKDREKGKESLESAAEIGAPKE